MAFVALVKRVDKRNAFRPDRASPLKAALYGLLRRSGTVPEVRLTKWVTRDVLRGTLPTMCQQIDCLRF